MNDARDGVRLGGPSGPVEVLNTPLFLGMKVEQGGWGKEEVQDKSPCVVVMTCDLAQERLGSCPPAVGRW